MTMRFFCFPRQKKHEPSIYKPLINKSSRAVKGAPPAPPSRRPNIKERISMIEMAQLNHLGVYTPDNGIRIILPRDKKRYDPPHGVSFHGEAPATTNVQRRSKVEVV